MKLKISANDQLGRRLALLVVIRCIGFVADFNQSATDPGKLRNAFGQFFAIYRAKQPPSNEKKKRQLANTILLRISEAIGNESGGLSSSTQAQPETGYPSVSTLAFETLSIENVLTHTNILLHLHSPGCAGTEHTKLLKLQEIDERGGLHPPIKRIVGSDPETVYRPDDNAMGVRIADEITCTPTGEANTLLIMSSVFLPTDGYFVRSIICRLIFRIVGNFAWGGGSQPFRGDVRHFWPRVRLSTFIASNLKYALIFFGDIERRSLLLAIFAPNYLIYKFSFCWCIVESLVQLSNHGDE
ncbi:hypothetical protein KQX54_000598 [Cotesia glomerata]|uniref:Uncharacterized protein n=1 Tax=Cotesia glomerata TaxID=32391 RepID=A0AAV7J0P3_COTGL|nr:hypothetical protein KQX54_000598 [Cotesia glomerata]